MSANLLSGSAARMPSGTPQPGSRSMARVTWSTIPVLGTSVMFWNARTAASVLASNTPGCAGPGGHDRTPVREPARQLVAGKISVRREVVLHGTHVVPTGFEGEIPIDVPQALGQRRLRAGAGMRFGFEGAGSHAARAIGARASSNRADSPRRDGCPERGQGRDETWFLAFRAGPVSSKRASRQRETTADLPGLPRARGQRLAGRGPSVLSPSPVVFFAYPRDNWSGGPHHIGVTRRHERA